MTREGLSLTFVLRVFCEFYFILLLVVGVDVPGDPFFTAAASHRPTMKKHYTSVGTGVLDCPFPRKSYFVTVRGVEDVAPYNLTFNYSCS